MDAIVPGEVTKPAPKPTIQRYKSRPGALAWCFRKSRDLWKAKYRDLKASIERLTHPVADLTKSRDRWRLQAEQAQGQLVALQEQVAGLEAEVVALTAEKKNGRDDTPLRGDIDEQRVARGQQYSLGVVQRFLTLVIDQGASFRCAAAALDLLWPPMGPEQASPAWSTGRLWLLRIGLAALVRPKVIADDWVWMIDHSIQIGPCKCLVILGLRLSEFTIAGPLCHQDMELIDLVPMDSATKHTVAVCLAGAVAKTGAPRAILSDHAADLHGAIAIFRGQHPETSELYDLKHKAACLLKALLERDEPWKRFTGLAAQAKVALQQTDAACLVPPSQRSKSRFMNLSELVRWGRQTLALLDDPSRLERLPGSPDAVRDKRSWLAEFRESLSEWSAYHELIEGALDFVRSRGLYLGVGPDLAAALPAAPEGAARELRERLIAFVTAESSQARAGEILPGTTEVLESCFGRLKALEDGQSKSGFTGLVLSLGAMVSTRTAEMIGEALERCRGRDVLDWCREKLGESVQSLRRRAYAEPEGATELGWAG